MGRPGGPGGPQGAFSKADQPKPDTAADNPPPSSTGGGDDQAPPLGRDESGDGPPDFDPGGPPGGGPPDFGPGGPPGGGPPGFGPGGPPGGGPPGFGGTPGFQRFIRPSLASQITWLFPLAVLGAVSFWFHEVRGSSGQRQRIALYLWGGWLGTHWIVFSFAQGIFHDYYTTVMGPAVAALAAFGAVSLWHEWSRSGGRRGLLWLAMLLTAGWQAYLLAQDSALRPWALPILAAGVLADVVGLAGFRWAAARGSDAPWTRYGMALGMASMLVGPTSWSIATTLQPGMGLIPAANLAASGGPGGPGGGMPGGPGGGRPGGPRGRMPGPGGEMDPASTEKLVTFLRANRHGERFLVAGFSSMEMAPLIIATKEMMICLGGFMGADPVVSRDEFARMVQAGEIRFVLLGGPGGGGPPGGRRGPGGQDGPGGPGGARNAEVIAWVREHGKAVDTERWQINRSGDDEDGPRMFRPMGRLYDCRSDLDLVDATTD